MTAQSWVACLGRQSCLTQWINLSSLRILDGPEIPKSSDLTNYNYIYWKKKEILKLRRVVVVVGGGRYVEKMKNIEIKKGKKKKLDAKKI